MEISATQARGWLGVFDGINCSSISMAYAESTGVSLKVKSGGVNAQVISKHHQAVLLLLLVVRLKVSVVVAQEIAQRTVSGLRESGVDAEKMAMPAFLPRLLAVRKHVVGVEPQLQSVLMKTLGKHS